VRNLGVHANEIAGSVEGQLSMFGAGAGQGAGLQLSFSGTEPTAGPAPEELDKAVDSIRERFGKDAVKRGL
jgi:hypothetical protein